MSCVVAILKRDRVALYDTLFYNEGEGSGHSALFGFMGVAVQDFSC